MKKEFEVLSQCTTLTELVALQEYVLPSGIQTINAFATKVDDDQNIKKVVEIFDIKRYSSWFLLQKVVARIYLWRTGVKWKENAPEL